VQGNEVVGVFASYFWLWSIVGLLGLIFLYAVGALMSFGGFLTPLRRIGRWADAAPATVKVALLVATFAILAYPSLAHKLWADATAREVRLDFEALPKFPGAEAAPVLEQMKGLYDPTGTDGTYVIGWFGTQASFADVLSHYENALSGRGWVRQPGSGAARDSRLQFRDDADATRSHYELVLAQVSVNSQDVPAQLTGSGTVFAIRLGVVDPRLTTQVAWFIDCLVRRAPTFPTCEAMGWHPLEPSLDPATGSAPPPTGPRSIPR
jgi:hypothetical protein